MNLYPIVFLIIIKWFVLLSPIFLVLAIFFLIRIIKNSPKFRNLYLIISSIFIAVLLLVIYSGLIEKNMLKVYHHDVDLGVDANIVVIADLHIGVYKDKSYLEKVVKEINNLDDIDFVVIAGDFAYHPTDKQLKDDFSPLRDIKFPVYAVLGNHDEQKPGPPITEALKQVLEENNVKLIDNKVVVIPEQKIALFGLGDRWARKDDIEWLDTELSFMESEDANLVPIVLTHNPDTTLLYRNIKAKEKPELTITGHTHGGQVRVPFIYKSQIPVRGDFDEGLYSTSNGKVFVTAGLGEVGLPMRFQIPPRIDVLHLHSL